MFVKLFLSHYLSLAVTLLSCYYSFFMLVVCTRCLFKAPAQQRTLFLLLMIFVFGIFFNNSCYMFYFILCEILGCKAWISFYTFACRLNWGLYITTYQAFALFFEYFNQKRLKISITHAIHGLINIGLSGQFLYLAFVRADGLETVLFEQTLTTLVYCYLFIFCLQLIYRIFIKAQMPRILSDQMRYLSVFLAAYLLLEMAITIGATRNLFGAYYHSFFALSTLFGCYAVYAMSLMGLRFLNFRPDVESKEKFNFLVQFKDVLEQLSYATTLKELAHLSQTFFQAAYAIPLDRTRLYLRKMRQEDFGYYGIATITTNVEHFIGKSENQAIIEALKASKIFIRDEIEFTQYYECDEKSQEILEFLDVINAEIFLPIFERNTIAAYIIVERDARPQKLFTHKERDELIVFASYLRNTINSLNHSTIESMHQRQEELADELYHKRN